MRDPNRIPMILAALERRWRQDPDQRLGQFLLNVYRRARSDAPAHPLFGLEDGELLRLLGPETEEERRYVAEEPAARRRGWRKSERVWREHRRRTD